MFIIKRENIYRNDSGGAYGLLAKGVILAYQDRYEEAVKYLDKSLAVNSKSNVIIKL